LLLSVQWTVPPVPGTVPGAGRGHARLSGTTGRGPDQPTIRYWSGSVRCTGPGKQWQALTPARVAISGGPWRTRQDALIQLVLDHQQTGRQPSKSTPATLTRRRSPLKCSQKPNCNGRGYDPSL